MNSQNSLYGQGVSRDTLPVVPKKEEMKRTFCLQQHVVTAKEDSSPVPIEADPPRI